MGTAGGHATPFACMHVAARLPYDWCRYMSLRDWHHAQQAMRPVRVESVASDPGGGLLMRRRRERRQGRRNSVPVDRADIVEPFHRALANSTMQLPLVVESSPLRTRAQRWRGNGGRPRTPGEVGR